MRKRLLALVAFVLATTCVSVASAQVFRSVSDAAVQLVESLSSNLTPAQTRYPVLVLPVLGVEEARECQVLSEPYAGCRVSQQIAEAVVTALRADTIFGRTPTRAGTTAPQLTTRCALVPNSTDELRQLTASSYVVVVQYELSVNSLSLHAELMQVDDDRSMIRRSQASAELSLSSFACRRSDGAEPTQRTTVLAPQQIGSLEVRSTTASDSPPISRLSLRLNPAAALVRVDDVPVELSQHGEVAISRGVHVLEVAATGFYSRRVAIQVEEGRTYPLQLSLQPIVLPSDARRGQAAVAQVRTPREGTPLSPTALTAAVALATDRGRSASDAASEEHLSCGYAETCAATGWILGLGGGASADLSRTGSGTTGFFGEVSAEWNLLRSSHFTLGPALIGMVNVNQPNFAGFLEFRARAVLPMRPAVGVMLDAGAGVSNRGPEAVATLGLLAAFPSWAAIAPFARGVMLLSPLGRVDVQFGVLFSVELPRRGANFATPAQPRQFAVVSP